MTAESENETGAPKRRGRIPQSAWPQILERYKSGATLSAIAREFDCTPSAISYIVRKAEKNEGGPESDAGEAAAPAPVEVPQPRADAPAAEAAPAPADAPPVTAPPEQGREAPPRREGRNRLEIGGRAPRQPEGGEQPEERQDRGERPERGDRQDRGQRFGQGRPERGDRNNRDRGGADRPERLGTERLGMDRPDRQPPRQERGDRSEQFDQPERFGGDQAYPYHRQRTNAARQEAQETPAQPADERMATAAQVCADLYRAWRTTPGEESMQALADALHEMRKVVARMEIDMSASRRDEQRPIPVQQYRTLRPPQQPRG